jgi:hypothetical protein
MTTADCCEPLNVSVALVGVPEIVAGLITKLPVTEPKVYPEPGVIEIFVGYTYVPASTNELGVPEGAGLAGVPVSVYALATPLNVTGPPLITTFCVTGTGIEVHVIVQLSVFNVFPVIVSVMAQ